MEVLTNFKKCFQTTARAESILLAGMTRGDAILHQRILHYSKVTKISFPTNTPVDCWHYSGAFISFCVRAAGASADEFPSQSRHSEYVRFAALNPDRAIFRVQNLNFYAPQIGDLINLNRDGGSESFESAGKPKPYDSESGIVVELSTTAEGKIANVIIGNDHNGGVSGKRFRLEDNGLLAQTTKNPIICVLEATK